MTRIPLDIDSEAEAKHLDRTIAHHLGDKLYQRNPDRYPDVDVPELLTSNAGLASPSKTDSEFGPLIAFCDGGPFASIHIWEGDDEGEYKIAYTGQAAWDKYGTIHDLEAYFRAFDSLLSQLGVLHDEYTVTCPCGFEKTVGSSFTDVRKALNNHNADHDERIPNHVLMGREITGENKPTTTPEKSPIGSHSQA